MIERPLMIMVAPTGARTLKSANPSIPLSPAEIADEVIRCGDEGASIAHIHARAPDGQPTSDIAIFREIVERIRARSDIVLQLSLGTIGFSVDQALEPLDLGTEMVSLPLRAFQTDDRAAQDDVRTMAKRIKAAGVKPELDVASPSMLAGALGLIDADLVASPACFGLNMKEPESMQDGATSLMQLSAALPEGSFWWTSKGGRYALGLRSLAIELGGQVRTGFEDSVMDYDGRGLAPSNASQVKRVADLANVLGRSVATPADVRRILGFA